MKWVWIAACAIAFGIGSPVVRAQTEPPARPADGTVSAAGQVPDVQIAVAPGKSGWSIALVYPRKTSKDAMRADVDAVSKAVGAPAKSVRYEDRRLERLDTKGVGEAPVMSSASFDTDANLVDYSGGRVAAEVLITALQARDRIAVVFFVPGKFAWSGARSYRDDKLTVDVTGGEGAYVFVANIRSRPLAPFTLEVRGDPVLESSAPRERRRFPWGVVLGAIVAAAVAFGFARAWSRR
ncbi:MAG: hypothetical protein ACKO5K_04850 [Armatimonadota bacterium]